MKEKIENIENICEANPWIAEFYKGIQTDAPVICNDYSAAEDGKIRLNTQI